jgi:ketosteroid isomerase-like protein
VSQETADAEVLAANSAFYEAFETGDLDRMRDLWVPHDQVLCIHPGAAPIHGAAAVMRSWALIMANTTYIQFFLTDVTVSRTGTLAAVTCTENMLAGEGDEVGFRGGRAAALNVFTRWGGSWRMWIHQAAPVMSDVP